MAQLVLRQKKKKKARSRAVPAAPASKQEVTALGKAIRSLGGVIGSAGGGMLGMPGAGGMIGSSLAGALSKWIGAGDYTIGTNTVVQRSLKAASSIPSMHSDAQSVVVRHKEYLGEIRSSAAFNVQQSFPINPGSSQTFPWLSGIAVRFQEYKLRGAVFHYIPTSGSAVSSTNAALGSVMLQTSYRATDVLPGSKVEMLNEYCSNEVVPCDSMAHPIECDPKENPFNVMYVRSGTLPAGETALMYDLGVTHVAVSGCQTTGNVIGDLWVTYEVELKKPLIASNVTSQVLSAGGVFTTGGISLTTPFSTSLSTLSGSMGATVLNNELTFPKGLTGTWQVWMSMTGSSLAATYATPVPSGCTLVNTLSGGTFVNISGSTIIDAVWAVRIPDPSINPTLVFGFGGTGTLTQTRITITEMA